MNSHADMKSTGRKSSLPAKWPGWFIFIAGGILAIGGFTKFLAVIENFQPVNISDPVIGVSFRYLMPAVGIIELLAAYLCLFTNKRNLSFGLIAWLTTYYLVYRIVLWSIGWHHPYVLLGNLMEIFNVSPFLADDIVGLSSGFLLAGIITWLWFGKRNRTGLLEVPVGSLKISCAICGGRIEFPANLFGEKTPCPHCRAIITLKETVI
jgi:hypothetical protein